MSFAGTWLGVPTPGSGERTLCRGLWRFLLGRRPLPGSLAPQASGIADPPGSVAGGAFHGRKGRPSDRGKRDGCDDEFFHCVLLKLTPAFLCLVTDARGTLPRARRLTPARNHGPGTEVEYSGRNPAKWRSFTPRIRGDRENLSEYFRYGINS